MARLSLLKKHKNTLKNRPLVVGSLVGSFPLSPQIRKVQVASLDVLEVRLDTFPQIYSKNTDPVFFCEALLVNLAEKLKLPLLLTLRSYKEAGVRLPKTFQKNNAWRANLLMALLPFVDLIDVEIREKKFAAKVTSFARKMEVDVIHSAHDFRTPGSWPKIKKLSELSKKMKGAIFKVAVTTKNEEETMEFLSRGMSLDHPNKVLIAMGSPGGVSRFLGYSFSSILTYGHLGASAAPGQVAAKDLADSIREIYRDK